MPRGHWKADGTGQLALPRAARAQRAARIVTHLRYALPTRERAITSWIGIATYLHSLGVRNAQGRRLTVTTLYEWRRHHGLPVRRANIRSGMPYPILTSTFALSAWLLSDLAPRYLRVAHAPTQDVDP